MKREPAIHINRKRLVLVLKDIFKYEDIEEMDENALADQILIRSKSHSLTHRSINVDKAKLFKSTSRVILSLRDDASVFSNLITLVRRQKKHIGIQTIKVGSSNWLQVKEIAKNALEFCEHFGLKREEGFKEYINIAIDRMNGFSINKFHRLHEDICNTYNSRKDIEFDMTPQLTTKAKLTYEKLLAEKAIIVDHSNDASKLIFFLKAKDEALSRKVPIDIYIKAQFDGLEWANSYPEPYQLVGPKALERLNKYLVKIKYKPGESSTIEKDKKLAEELKNKWGKR